MQHFQVVCRTVAISNKSILSIDERCIPAMGMHLFSITSLCCI